MYTSRKSMRGYSLIEMILTVGMVSAIALYSFPMLMTSQAANDLKVTAHQVEGYIKEAQLLALSQENSSDWGVYVSGGNLTMYSGDTYATRDTTYDVTIALQDGVSSAANYDLNFAQMSGQLASTGTIILQNSLNEQKTITISTYGKLTY